MIYEEEIKKMEQEDKVVEIQAKSYINDFITDIKKVDKAVILDMAQPQKLKIPFKVRLKRFLDKLNKTLG